MIDNTPILNKQCPVEDCRAWKSNASRRNKQRWYCIATYRSALAAVHDDVLLALPSNNELCPSCHNKHIRAAWRLSSHNRLDTLTAAASTLTAASFFKSHPHRRLACLY